jgi:membrane protein required for colicin V production
MNWLDILILIPAAWYAFKGLKNGLIYELASILALILGVWATVHYSDMLAARMGEGQTYKIIAFAGIFIATLVIVHFAGKLVEKVIKLMIPGFLNNLAGLLFGVAKVVIVFSVIIMFVNKVDTKEVILKEKTKTGSFTYKYVEPVAPFLTNWITEKRGQVSGVSGQWSGISKDSISD